ncbi:MAG TPA: vanadium-dependent haloperoxidase [Roseiflexaceae bacterium]|nr:vanadium-dependent haloperoxidase [Roseiflexaceae bacterium]
MSINRLIVVLVALAALVTPTLAQHPISAQAATPSSPAAVITWNGIARRTAIQVGGQTTAHAMASIAFAQAAVYDAVVAIEGGYQPYQVRLAQVPDASINAAVATAAHHVLVHYFPAQQAALDADYATALAAVPDGPARVAGVAVGQATAAGIIARRQGDGLAADIGFSMPAPAPGVWQLPTGQNPMTPWASKLRPFTLRSPNQFRPDPPLALASRAWAANFNEIKAIGSLNSTSRTADQTDIARFWTTNPVVQYNAAFEEIALVRGLDTVQTARLFAMGNLVGADALIACFDAKYHYLFWRPQFAIPLGDSDGNPATVGDPAWKPLLGAPPHPEYPSGHGCLTAAEAEVLTAFLGTSQIEIDLTSTVPNLSQPRRHYVRATDLMQEVMNARVWGGIHFRDATIKGAGLGRKVAQWALKRYFLPER